METLVAALILVLMAAAGFYILGHDHGKRDGYRAGYAAGYDNLQHAERLRK
jgi:hypothetical protein